MSACSQILAFSFSRLGLLPYLRCQNTWFTFLFLQQVICRGQVCIFWMVFSILYPSICFFPLFTQPLIFSFYLSASNEKRDNRYLFVHSLYRWPLTYAHYCLRRQFLPYLSNSCAQVKAQFSLLVSNKHLCKNSLLEWGRNPIFNVKTLLMAGRIS